MSKSERLNKEIDLLTKLIIFFMTLSGAVIAYAYINKDVIALIALALPVYAVLITKNHIQADLDLLEKE